MRCSASTSGRVYGGSRVARAVAVTALTLCVSSLQAQLITVDRMNIDDDRWMYPFNGTPGNRFTASSFGAPLVPGFDDRDGQFLVAINTAPQIPTGLDPSNYHLVSARVTAFISTGNVFVYDPTPDAIETVYAPTDPQFIADSDPGRAIELFPVGYRSGFTNLGWIETSPFSLAPPVIAPVQGNRTAFAAEFDAVGNALDVSNQLKDRRSSPAAAVGLSTVAPGASVPVDTRFDFEVDLSVPGVRAYLQRSLAEGRVRFAITSLHQTNFDPENPGGGPGALTFPIFYTSENPLAQFLGLTPRMQLTVWVGSRADFDQSGTVNIFDVIAFLAAWNAGDPLADIDGNGTLSVFDIIGFLTEFNAG